MLKPVIFGKLAHPCGVALSPAENALFVCETLKNRILRVVIHSSGVFHTSVFHQFSGRLGPTSIAINESGHLYVARFDFAETSKHGMITVLNEDGEAIDDLMVNDAPELTGLWFNIMAGKKSTLY